MTVPAASAACIEEQMLATIPATGEINFESLMMPPYLEAIIDFASVSRFSSGVRYSPPAHPKLNNNDGR